MLRASLFRICIIGICTVFSLLSAASSSSQNKRRNPELQSPPVQTSPGIDPHLKDQWYLKRIKADRAWTRFTEGQKITVVAVLDSGVMYNHPEIAANIWRNPGEIPNNGIDDDGNGFVDDLIGWDFVRNINLPYDRGGHGMFMSTIIAGIKDNSVGGSGVCPKCSIMPVRFLNWDGLGDDEDVPKSLNYATNTGARVANLSFAGEGQDEDILRALEHAAENDVFVVIAAGNDSENINHTSVYPAKYNLPNTLTVAASGRNDDIIKKSNWGDKYVHVAVPAEDVFGFWLNDWDKGAGTSNAAAIASGAVGLIRSAAPHLTAAQVKQIILATVEDVPVLRKKTISGGIIDVEAAVACAVDRRLSCLR